MAARAAYPTALALPTAVEYPAAVADPPSSLLRTQQRGVAMRPVRRTDQFRVVAGVFGRVFTVIERTEFNWTEGRRGPEAIRGFASLETTEGYALTPVGKDCYEIAALGLLVQRVPEIAAQRA